MLERRLAAFVDDLELILFSRLPENQVFGMAAVLADAQAVFDGLSYGAQSAVVCFTDCRMSVRGTVPSWHS